MPNTAKQCSKLQALQRGPMWRRLRVPLQLAFLARAIQQAVLDGTRPEGLTRHRLTRPEMPADRSVQYARTGITLPS